MFVFFHALTFALMGLFGGCDGGSGYLHSAGYVQSSPDDGGGSMPTDGGGSMPGQGGGG
ncbi:MAG TPA: hypothetical protein VHS56_03570 [Candidatus Cybelea sp.]|nr:hypothetical protein [Candidatus Cybelea sp.]